MKIIWLAVSITIYSGIDKIGIPDVTVVPHGEYETKGECRSWLVDQYKSPKSTIDSATGKPVLDYHFDCIPQTIDEALKSPDRFRSGD